MTNAVLIVAAERRSQQTVLAPRGSAPHSNRWIPPVSGDHRSSGEKDAMESVVVIKKKINSGVRAWSQDVESGRSRQPLPPHSFQCRAPRQSLHLQKAGHATETSQIFIPWRRFRIGYNLATRPPTSLPPWNARLFVYPVATRQHSDDSRSKSPFPVTLESGDAR
jgi:hypothetical protein